MLELIRLENVECHDCYKCIRNCPVKAIRYANGQVQIMQAECIYCGECVVTCPQHGEFIENKTEEIRAAIASGRPVVASVAPSFIAELPVGSIEGMRATLKKLGFTDVQETAHGVEVVAREYERIQRDGEQEVLISSCCASVVELIRKYYPDLLGYLAPVKSPMLVHGEMIKKKYPDAFIVFIGSCYAKKAEADASDCVDTAITIYELKSWMKHVGCECVYIPNTESEGKRARRYPRQDGLVKAMTAIPGWNRVAIDGVTDCIAALNEIRHGGVKHTFLEMTACEGSCVNGPAIRKGHFENRIKGTVAVNEYSGNADFGIKTDVKIRHEYTPTPVVREKPADEDVIAVLRKLGKDTQKTALNCGACGYPTCRKMADAICRGMAQPDMCLPYLREKVESHSREIIDSTLEAADQVIDKQMRVVQNIASLLGETTAETKLMLTKLKEAVQSND